MIEFDCGLSGREPAALNELSNNFHAVEQGIVFRIQFYCGKGFFCFVNAVDTGDVKQRIAAMIAMLAPGAAGAPMEAPVSVN
ncbi:MAG: hypothetical protein AAFX54_03845 [Pseudomonadota bacterium]